MKTFVIGGDGRGHVLVDALANSPEISELWCAPGNAGIAQERLAKNGALVQCVNIQTHEVDRLLTFALEKGVQLTVVGPDLPLSLGVVDLFQQHGLRIWGPNRRAAMIEWSKAFFQWFVERFNVPAPFGEIFSRADHDAREFIRQLRGRAVVKADGLFNGKGALVHSSEEGAWGSVEDMLVHGKFGDAGKHTVIQERLPDGEGGEMSLHALCGARTALLFPRSFDYKRDKRGKMTGGTGGYSIGGVDDELVALARKIFTPWLYGCHSLGIEYTGVLYPGLMLTKEGPKCIEMNARLGDPEAQLYLTRLENDFLELIDASLSGTLGTLRLRWKYPASLCVALMNRNYPDTSEGNNEPIHGLAEAARYPNIKVFHGKTRNIGERICSGGGRTFCNGMGFRPSTSSTGRLWCCRTYRRFRRRPLASRHR